MNLKKLMDTLKGMLLMLAIPFKKSDSKLSIKETKEALAGLNVLSLFLIVRLKDGFQVGQDISALIGKLKNDDEFKKVLGDAMEGISKVPAEMKDVDVGEGIELVAEQVSYIDDFIEAVKKK